MRLGFAVAAHLDPEILVVDEVLAVGDAEFQKKAIGKMQEVSQGGGRTVLFVSHNMSNIRTLCQTGVFIENGCLKMVDEVNRVVDSYLESLYQAQERIGDNITGIADYLKLTHISVNGKEENPIWVSYDNPEVRIHLEGELSEDVNMAIAIRFSDKNSVPVGIYSPSRFSGEIPKYKKGHFEIDEVVHFPEGVNKGTFFGTLWLFDPYRTTHLRMANAIQLEFEGFPMKTGKVFDYGNVGLLFLK